MADDLNKQLSDAAEALWGKPLPEANSNAVMACEKANRVLMQLLDSCPVTQAMQFAVAYGWLLREQALANEQKVKLN